jgi:hypothetical protein
MTRWRLEDVRIESRGGESNRVPELSKIWKCPAGFVLLCN